jgi:hypothetical protein
MKKKYSHNGFQMTIERDGETIYADIEKGDFAGSLAMAVDLGAIESSCGTKALKVPASTLSYFEDCESEFSDSLA